nr:MAG TPA: hypothetical protein [Caudoviricetes sp.]
MTLQKMTNRLVMTLFIKLTRGSFRTAPFLFRRKGKRYEINDQ